MTGFSRRRFLSFISALSAAGCGGGGNSTLSTLAPQAKPDTAVAPVDTNPNPAPSPAPAPTPAPGQPAPGGNPVQLENAKTEAQGVTSEWYIADSDYAINREIEGYASATSVRRGDSIRLYVSTDESSYTISVYRMGWYGGKGGRLVAGPIKRTGFRQPSPARDPATNLCECNWVDPHVLSIPANTADPTDWASGVYLAKLTGGTSGKQSYIIFTVRDDARHSAVLFQSSVTTYAAYNSWGGADFYDIDSAGGRPAYKVSFNRPYSNPQRPLNGKGAGDFLAWEILMLRFIEREGYDVSYCTNIDVESGTANLGDHRCFLSVGHDEYWTKTMRDRIEAARDRGVHLGFFGANAGYWQVRLEPGADSQPNRTVVCYKYDAPLKDPAYSTNPSQATVLWRTDIEGRPARPEAALIGVMYDYNSIDADIVMKDCSSWICDGAGLQKGSVLKGMLGYEVDRIDPLSSPKNMLVLAASPYNVCAQNCAAGETKPTTPTMETRYANVTYYTAASGAGVFATGSMQWNWGVDAFGPGADRVNTAVQRMTRNVLDRFSKG